MPEPLPEALEGEALEGEALEGETLEGRRQKLMINQKDFKPFWFFIYLAK